MFEKYQNFKIYIYYTEETQAYLKWAKTFFLLKSAHPIEFIKLESDSLTKFDNDPKKWLEKHLRSFSHLKGLFVPATVRPLVEIDFLTDSSSHNRYGIFQDGSACICCNNPDDTEYLSVDIQDVFEDLSLAHAKLNEEIVVIREKLLLNI